MHRIVVSRSVLAVRNLKESTRFYTDLLGFRRDLLRESCLLVITLPAILDGV